MLSACETGKGKVFKAEGVVGFTRAFLYAGAPRVIVSLWKDGDVPAATALKQAQAFVAGGWPSDALRGGSGRAKRDRRGGEAHPYDQVSRPAPHRYALGRKRRSMLQRPR